MKAPFWFAKCTPLVLICLARPRNPAYSTPWVVGDVGAGDIPVFVLDLSSLCVVRDYLSGSGIAVSNVAMLLEKVYFY